MGWLPLHPDQRRQRLRQARAGRLGAGSGSDAPLRAGGLLPVAMTGLAVMVALVAWLLALPAT